MGDPRAAVPYQDPQDGSTLDQQRLLHEFHDEPPPTMSDIYNNPFPPNPNFPSADYYNTQFPQSGTVPGDQTMFGFGSMAAGSTAGFTYGSSSQGAGPSGSNDGAGPSNTQNTNFGNARLLPRWPVLSEPYKCSCCQVLREIVHANGRDLTKLELHGRIGLISHAILETRQGFQGNHEGNTHQMIDFLKKGLDDVRQYLWRYCEEKSLAGYKLIPDTLSTYYEAVCVGLIWDDIAVDDLDDYFEAYPLNPPEAAQYAPPPNEPPPPNGPPENAPPADQQPPPPPDQQPPPVQNNPAGANPPAQNQDAGNRRTFLALQRQRAANMTLVDLARYFHLPIGVAAHRLNLCPTVVKRICRKHGLLRWPHRKIMSIKRLISKINGRLGNQNEQERQASLAEIETLEHKMDIMRYGVPEAD